jgi:undecaprenyl-diphosphatase
VASRWAFSGLWLRVSVLCALLFVADLAVVESDRFIGYEVGLRNDYFSLFRDALPFNALPALHAIEFVGVVSHPYLASATLFGAICLCAAGLFLVDRRVWSSALLITAVFGDLALAGVTKAVIVRPLDGRWRHTFPSGHAMTSFVLCSVLIYLLWHSKLQAKACWAGVILLLMLGVLYGLSALTFHYPSEVLGGYALGGAWLALLLCAFSTRLGREAESPWP